MKNFRAEQQQAKWRSRLLLLLFLLACTVLWWLTEHFLLWLLSFAKADSLNQLLYVGRVATDSSIPWLPWSMAVVIGSAVLYRLWQLKRGGAYIAEQLGGRLVSGMTRHPQERQLLNIVEELAIAANLPVPAVYLLMDVSRVNAFAAGFYPQDCVIAVSRGAIEQLTRDELQAVVAHEFAHIEHGDVRLNSMMAALLYGISFIGEAGENLLQASIDGAKASQSQRGSPAGFTAIIGLLLLVFGWFGHLLADAIKAAVCRQREFLADATAVQLTRQAQPLADALRVIAGDKRGKNRRFARAHGFSHLFFDDVLNPWLSWFSSHPPLAARIRALDPSWQGQVTERYVVPANNYQRLAELSCIAPASGELRSAPSFGLQAAEALASEPPSSLLGADQISQPAAAARDWSNLIDYQPPTQLPNLLGVDRELLALVHEPDSAMAAIVVLCLSDDWQLRGQQLRIVARTELVAWNLVDRLESLLAPLSRLQQWPLLSIALSALHGLSRLQQQAWLQLLSELQGNLQGAQGLWPYLLSEISLRQLKRPQWFASPMPRTRVEQACALLLSTLAQVGQETRSGQQLAFRLGATELQLERVALAVSWPTWPELTMMFSMLEKLPIVARERILKAGYVVANADRQLTTAELQLLFAIAMRLGVSISLIPELSTQPIIRANG